MMRSVMILLLLLSTAVMMRGVASDWRQGPPVPAEVTAKKATDAQPVGGLPLPQSKKLQPVVTGAPPNLKDGYLFNQERMLAGAAPPPTEEESADQEVSPLGIEASIDEVIYTGSVITETTSQALIVYPAEAKAKAKAPPQPTSRSSRFKSPRAATSAGGEEHGRLEVGDMLDGYEVAEILPDTLIFTKDDERVEKRLHDPEKKRIAPPPRPAGPGPGAPRPLPGGPASPSGVQSTTIGGSAPAATPASQARPGQPAPKLPGAPPPATTRPTQQLRVPAVAPGTRPSPVRRMVISRQPAQAPDTSRVLRRSPDADIEGPLPPGMAPGGGDIPSPPMPGQ